MFGSDLKGRAGMGKALVEGPHVHVDSINGVRIDVRSKRRVELRIMLIPGGVELGSKGAIRAPCAGLPCVPAVPFERLSPGRAATLHHT